MRAVWIYFGAMLPYMLGSLPVVALGLLVWAKRKKQKDNWWRIIGLGIFFVFMAGLLSQAALPLGGELAVAEPYFHLRGTFNFVPLRFVGETLAALRVGDYAPLALNVCGNVFMFAPIGFFAGLLWADPGLKRAALFALCVSVFIELCQLFQFRATDVDDVLLNVLGGLLGYGAYALLRKLAPQFCARFKPEKTQK